MTQILIMEPATMRHLWSIIESTQANIILRLSDTDLVKQLIKKLDTSRPLTTEEKNAVMNYLYSRIVLIRDLAATRHSSLAAI